MTTAIATTSQKPPPPPEPPPPDPPPPPPPPPPKPPEPPPAAAKISCSARSTSAYFDDVPRIWTIGYEKLRPEALVAELEAAGVERVIDVRYRPQSRRPGMSKTRLGERLADSRIVYEHRRALGTPADLRWLFKAGRVEEGRAAYREHVEAHAADDLDALAAELDRAPHTALLCLEADPAVCHRRVLVEALARRRADLEVVDL